MSAKTALKSLVSADKKGRVFILPRNKLRLDVKFAHFLTFTTFCRKKYAFSSIHYDFSHFSAVVIHTFTVFRLLWFCFLPFRAVFRPVCQDAPAFARLETLVSAHAVGSFAPDTHPGPILGIRAVKVNLHSAPASFAVRSCRPEYSFPALGTRLAQREPCASYPSTHRR